MELNYMVTVIDALPGKGKSSYIIDYMKTHTNNKYIYVTPLLSETERVEEQVDKVTAISNELSKALSMPKREIVNLMISSDESIAISHALFESFNEDTIQNISDRGYTLIIDETVSCITPVSFSAKEIQILDDNNALVKTKAKNGATRVVWNPDTSLRATRLEKMYRKYFNSAKEIYLGNDNKIMVCSLPDGIYEAVEKAFVLTYNFIGTDMEAYFKFHNIEYEMKTIKDNKISDFVCVDNGSEFKSLINIIDHKVNRVGDKHGNSNKTPLTKGWYLNASENQLKKVSDSTYNYFHNICKAQSCDNLVTVFEDSEIYEYIEDEYQGVFRKELGQKSIKSKILRAPFNTVGRIPKDVDKHSEEYRKRQCFIPCNSRATNLYSDRHNVAYLVDMRQPPTIEHFFNSFKIDIDGEVFSLNAMIQVVWRSAIRKGEKINLYVPSPRMRHMLLLWLGYSEEGLF